MGFARGVQISAESGKPARNAVHSIAAGRKTGMLKFIKDKKFIAIIAIAVIIAVSIALFLFSFALTGELKAKYSECNLIEAKVFEARNMIESVRQVPGVRVLTTDKNIAQGIHELKKHGRAKEVKFISITPKELKEDHDSGYRILPVEMKIESAHEQLAAFLGSLDDLEEGLIKVISFEMAPNKTDPAKCITELTVRMYFSDGENAE